MIPLDRALVLARIALAFGRVERATFHEDGVRPETDTDHTHRYDLCTTVTFLYDFTEFTC